MNIQFQFYVFNPPLGGVENYFLNAGKALIAKGHKVSVLCTRNEKGLPEREKIAGMDVIRHPHFLPPKHTPWRRPEVFVDGLADFMRGQPSPDAIISRHCFYAAASMKAFHGFRNMIFLPPAGLLATEDVRMKEFSLRHRFVHRAMRKSIASIETKALMESPHLATLSANMRDQLAAFYDLDLSRDKIVPPGIDSVRFKKNAESAKKFRRELGMPEDRVVILTVGRIVPEKNHIYLARAMKFIDPGKVHWVQVGDGDPSALKSELGGRVSEVSFFTTRKDIENFYNMADIFIMPSYFEPFGHVILEAMASELPVVGLKRRPPEVCVANEEIVVHGETGLLVSGSSPEECAEAIELLVVDKAKRLSMGKLARQQCVEKYSWEKHVETLLKIIAPG